MRDISGWRCLKTSLPTASPFGESGIPIREWHGQSIDKGKTWLACLLRSDQQDPTPMHLRELSFHVQTSCLIEWVGIERSALLAGISRLLLALYERAQADRT